MTDEQNEKLRALVVAVHEARIRFDLACQRNVAMLDYDQLLQARTEYALTRAAHQEAEGALEGEIQARRRSALKASTSREALADAIRYASHFDEVQHLIADAILDGTL